MRSPPARRELPREMGQQSLDARLVRVLTKMSSVVIEAGQHTEAIGECESPMARMEEARRDEQTPDSEYHID